MFEFLLVAMASRSRRPVISPSLLENIKLPSSPSTKRRIKENFRLGMGEWTDSDDSEDFQPLKKKAKRHAKGEGSTGVRFGELTSKEELAKKSKGVIPKRPHFFFHSVVLTFNFQL